MTRRRDNVLLIDADDTLWENNIYFERAIAGFTTHLQRTLGEAAGVPEAAIRERIRERINAQERRIIVEMGYGLGSFRVALARAYRDVAPHAWNAEAEAMIAALAAAIAQAPIELMPGAVETLRYLAPRHRLLLLTKGDYAEQFGKVTRSGLASWFEQVHVVAEKDEAVYRTQLDRLGVPPGRCWMIGNSPRSDVNPALAAGLNAVFIPHPWTWVLEHDDIVLCHGRECLQLDRFADLRDHF